jgi:hypothetical protein
MALAVPMEQVVPTAQVAPMALVAPSKLPRAETAMLLRLVRRLRFFAILDSFL